MSLASNYATVLKAGVEPKQVVSYMIHRGHQSLLSQVMRILARDPAPGTLVVVAHERDAKKFSDATVVVDPQIVGGYFRRSGSTIVDATYRKRLVEIYKKAIA